MSQILPDGSSDGFGDEPRGRAGAAPEPGRSAQAFARALEAVPAERQAMLLAYLNLPPVGCIADVNDVPRPGSDSAYEVPARVRQTLRKRRDAMGGFRSLGDLANIPGFGVAELGEIVERLGDLGRYGHAARPVWGGPEGEKEFFALLESAERYIHISTYIVGGQTGLRLARLLARKMRQGVKVRLLFCASGFVISGSPSGTGFVSRFSELRSYLVNDLYVRRKIVKELRAAGVPFVNSSPIGRHWNRRDLRRQGVKNARDYYRWAREREIPDAWLEEQAWLDRECSFSFANVDHRKMAIVDGKRAFVGSQNLADSYFYANELDPDPRVNVRNWQWHDNSTIVEGGCVRDLNRLFASRWIVSGGDVFDWNDSLYAPPLGPVGTAAVGIITTIPGTFRVPFRKNAGRFLASLFGADRRPIAEGTNPIRDRMLALPELAQNDFYVEHCYPSDADLLQYWATRAVHLPDFRMVVPLFYDTKVTGDECNRFFPELLAAGVRLHGYHKAIMHSKIAVMDGFYVVTGSYNLTLRSARADLENEFFIQCSDYGGAVRERIRGDVDDCRDVTPGLIARYRSRRSVPFYDAVIRYFFL